MRRAIFDNPFDIERQFFMDTCRQQIPFLKDVESDILKHLYYKSRQCFYNTGQGPFRYGQKSTSIVIVVDGLLEIFI